MDNFTNPNNNMQNVPTPDYSQSGVYTGTQTPDYSQSGVYTGTQTPDYSQQGAYTGTQTPDYTQPGTYTGATAEWQAQKMAQQQANAYNQSYQNQYNATYNPVQPKKPLIGIAIASMVLGILSILCCCFLGYWSLILSITGVVLGIVALVKDYAGKGMAIAGVICSGVSIVLCIIGLIASAIGAAFVEDFINDIYREIGYEYYR